MKVCWSGGAIVDGMLAQTARRLADRVADEGLLDLAQQLRGAADEADRSNAASVAMHHQMTDEDPKRKSKSVLQLDHGRGSPSHPGAVPPTHNLDTFVHGSPAKEPALLSHGDDPYRGEGQSEVSRGERHEGAVVSLSNHRPDESRHQRGDGAYE